ncbi:MAG: hypothetical protein HYY10_04270, partial [Candidatus Liptonbacteria bacterium]|nr:hypothetical protein [Candidatus Liptonbacteria bacterium]
MNKVLGLVLVGVLLAVSVGFNAYQYWSGNNIKQKSSFWRQPPSIRMPLTAVFFVSFDPFPIDIKNFLGRPVIEHLHRSAVQLRL